MLMVYDISATIVLLMYYCVILRLVCSPSFPYVKATGIYTPVHSFAFRVLAPWLMSHSVSVYLI